MTTTVTQAIAFTNTLYNGNSSPPTSGDEDFAVWLSLFNIAIGVWETEEGMLWRQLFVKLADAADGDKTAAAGDYSYATPTNFSFPASTIVWIGTGTNKTPYKVVKQENLALYETNSENWCYFLMDTTPTLEFNPNCTVQAGTISYLYYKTATAVTTGSSTFEMGDPMFAVYYALNELKKDEGDATAGGIAGQKLEGMKTKNFMLSDNQTDSLLDEGGGL